MSVEHLLFALLFDTDCARVIQQSGGDVETIRRKLDKFLDTEIPHVRRDRRRHAEPDGRLSARGPARGHPRRSAGKDEVKGAQRAGGHVRRADSIAAHTLQEAGRHPLRRGQLHLARRQQGRRTTSARRRAGSASDEEEVVDGRRP